MSSSVIPLAEVLSLAETAVAVEPDRDYPNFGIYSFGKGVFAKAPISGARTSARTLYRTAAGQFVYSRLFAFEGAFAVVPAEFDGWYVSNEFPAFNCDTDRLDPNFLALYVQQPEVWLKIAEDSVGMGHRRQRVQPEALLRAKISLPPLSKQQAAVSFMNRVNERIIRSQTLRQDAMDSANRFIEIVETQILSIKRFATVESLEHVTSYLTRGRQSEQGDSDHVLVKTQHVQQGRYVPSLLRLAPHVARKVGTDAHLRNGDVLIACSAAGCLGRVARYQGDGNAASTDTHVAVARPDPSKVNPDFLYAYLRSAEGQFQLRSRERGDWRREKVGFRLTELNLADLRKVPVPVPPRSEQDAILKHLEAIHALTDELRTRHLTTRRRLQLLPSACRADILKHSRD